MGRVLYSPTSYGSDASRWFVGILVQKSNGEEKKFRNRVERKG